MAENRDNEPLLRRIDAVLARIVADSDVPPGWSEAWSRLGPDSSEEERLAVYQAVRDAGSIPREAGFYLVSWQIDVMTLHKVEGALDRTSRCPTGSGVAEPERGRSNLSLGGRRATATIFRWIPVGALGLQDVSDDRPRSFVVHSGAAPQRDGRGGATAARYPVGRTLACNGRLRGSRRKTMREVINSLERDWGGCVTTGILRRVIRSAAG